MSEPRLITVLGASGLLGTAIVRELAQRPVRLRLASRNPPKVPEDRRAHVETCTGDLTEPGAVARAVDGADVVIHLVVHSVGESTWRVITEDNKAERVNVGLVHDVLEAIRKQRPEQPPVLLFAGSMSQLVRDPSAEEDVPITIYDRHKDAAWQAIEQANEEGLVRGSSLQLATLYSQGPDQGVEDRSVVALMIRQALAGRPITMWFDGAPKRDLLCVDDAAKAFTAALDRIDRTAGRYWLIGRGEETTIGELFTKISETVSEYTGSPPVPVVPVPAADYAVVTDRMDFVLDPGPFEEVTGWSSRVPLEQGLKGAVVTLAESENGRGY
ncbi:NAD-dependent epimerase/dehydratase family protein [Nocardiopsis xinjiangensis]|uniref:NAD-dependent epimerase/dehydratase family protein n=1 Tax=Nocardiopsis xinjiangensis TaxID=124285 RepID=UPI00036CB113|nr:NAD-dependent epimerase/dehydratase [Nocardiopsis xinjiangensis]